MNRQDIKNNLNKMYWIHLELLPNHMRELVLNLMTISYIDGSNAKQKALEAFNVLK